ncbi:hypothetical protein ACO22_04177 [Paracoccidioides brasiliensis]|uniref:von Willebrand domain-containing protein n=1 Tax=Paracoccidioides brasiliensis TaxID=121759 RepID=A0A1D2JDX6_PARBR|nr:hypothetical protein ACO22_04177 [Paracoccidioides brasiliensis]
MYRNPFAGDVPECGCWFLGPASQRNLLPQVDLKVHSTILSASSRTTLTQTFINPTPGELKDVKYTFPLVDGVSVVEFTCEIGNRVIRGIVKEREEAKAEYQEALKKGQTAALLEQSVAASDTFTSSIGRIPVDSKAVVKITYLGELQHDAQADGIRFSIPSIICPRYGITSVEPHERSEFLVALVRKGAINITVDVSVDQGSIIRRLQSPSHPIAITLGRTSVTSQDVFEINLASATLAIQQENVFLDKDFVLIVNTKDQDIPSGFLETHPSIPNQRALMATLVPKFNIPPISPEIVFIIDRSGSMDGKIGTLQAALRVFLKSIPVGVTFNVCSFGSSYSFMWKKSRSYDDSSLRAALKYVDSVAADFGGTEMLKPVKATVENRFKDLDLEILLLTDGAIWDQETLFKYIHKAASDKPIRFFTLGIGDGASHSLIEGIAKAGNGFAQFVNDNEPLDRKVVRMLKGALTPHIKDYTAEVAFENDGSEDFEIIEKSNEAPTGDNFHPPQRPSGDTMDVDFQGQDTKEPISLFDPSYKEPDIQSYSVPVDANLPKLQSPKLLQAPYKIPSLYPFNRTTVYFLLSPDAPSSTPKALILKGTSKHGPLTLRIPIEDVGQGLNIHQLAARKITRELEDGRGWIYHAKNSKGQLIMDENASKKDAIVKREAVRLGLQFQVSGKYCSFVAVESTSDGEAACPKKDVVLTPDDIDYRFPPDKEYNKSRACAQNTSNYSVLQAQQVQVHGAVGCVGSAPRGGMSAFSRMTASLSFSKKSSHHYASSAAPAPAPPLGRTLGLPPPPPTQETRSLFLPSAPGGAFVPVPRPSEQPSHSNHAMRSPSASSQIDHVLQRSERMDDLSAQSDSLAQSAASFRRSGARGHAAQPEHKKAAYVPTGAAYGPGQTGLAHSSQDKVHALISLQSFEGSWQWDKNLFSILDLDSSAVERNLNWAYILGIQGGIDTKNTKQKATVATLLVLAYLNKKWADERETWELVGDKAMTWAMERIREIKGHADRESDELLSLFEGIF